MNDRPYLSRFIDGPLSELIDAGGAILISGPRGCGKTTTAVRRAVSLARLDVPAQRAQFVSDPDAALARLNRTAVVDEWQFVPDVMPAVKRAVDADPDTGPIILTGSAHSNRAPELWPGTGRISRLRMFGLTESEFAQSLRPDVVDRLLAPEIHGMETPLTLPDYLELTVRGGMPQPRLRGLDPARWYADYLGQLVDRDAADAGYDADADRLHRYLTALAENTAGVPSDATMYAAATITAKTARRYDALLDDLGLLHRVPAWTTNRLSRMTSRQKVYLTDTGLTAAALGVEVDDALADGKLFGRLIDTFVAAQIRPALYALRPLARLHHLRSSDGRHEVDLVIDLGHRGLIAIEVKATAAITSRDAKHLVWLRDTIPDRFRRGVVLHTGPDAFELGERIVAAPISSLWAD